MKLWYRGKEVLIKILFHLTHKENIEKTKEVFIDSLCKSIGRFLCNDLNISYCFQLKKILNYNLVDACLLLFKQGCKVVTTWHRRKIYNDDILYTHKLFQETNIIQLQFHRSSFRGFCLHIKNSQFEEQLLAGQYRFHRMHDSLSKIGVVLGRSMGKNSCSEYFYKTREEINEGFTYS